MPVVEEVFEQISRILDCNHICIVVFRKSMVVFVHQHFVTNLCLSVFLCLDGMLSLSPESSFVHKKGSMFTFQERGG